MKSIEETQRELFQRIQTEGALVAYEAALAVARDPKAPPPARATAATTLFRVAGYFDRSAAADRDVEPHQMTPDQLAAELRRIRRHLDRPETDIFS